MRIHHRMSRTMTPLMTILGLCCVFLLTVPGLVLSTPVGQSSSAPGQTEQAAAPGQASVQPPSMATTPPIGQPDDEKVKEALARESFSYNPNELLDPFLPFITPVELAPTPSPVTEEDSVLPPEPQRPLTPLQKMSLAEIERGLKAISWGDLGRKAVIEDSAGKGYIVSVGTPAGDKNGVVTDIFNDRLVIRQEIWDRKQKRMLPQNSVVKLRKEKEQ